MKSRIVLFVLLVPMVATFVAFGSVAEGPLYVWDGSAGDGQWETVGNWSTTGASYDHPNQEFGNEYFNQDCERVVLINGDTISSSMGLSPDGARDGSTTCLMTLDNATTLNIGGTMWIADAGGTKGRVDVLGGSTLTATGHIKVGDDDLSVGTLNIIGSTVDIGDDLIIANRDGSTGYLNIGGDSVVNVADRFYMNDGGGSEPSFSQVVMDSGIVTTGYNCYFNDDASKGTAYFTLNSGTWNSGGTVDVSWNLDGISHLTINDGLMTAATEIRLGVSGGGDTGESRVFLNGGKLLGEDLQFNMTNSQIIFTGGELWINGGAVSEAAMQSFIDTGKIDVSGAPGYSIYTDAGYTVLVPEPATVVLLGLGGLSLIRRRRR